MKTNQRPIQHKIVPGTSIAIAALVLFAFAHSVRAQTQPWTNANAQGNINNTNSGNVGIGTSTPDKRLTVQGDLPFGGNLAVIRTTGANNAYGLALDASGSGNNNLGFMRNGATKASFAWDNSRNFLGFVNTLYSPNDFTMRLNSDGSFTYNEGVSGAERFRITAAGNVGIGTTTPGEKLVTFGNFLAGNITSRTQLYSTYESQGNVTMELGYGTPTSNITPLPVFVLSKNLTNPNTGVGSFTFANSGLPNGTEKRLTGFSAYTDGATNSGAFAIQTTAAGVFAERMRITSAGNVGIGTATPNFKLDVNGEINATGLRINGTPISSGGSPQWTPSGSNISYSAGNVGIGTGNPTAKLHVAGNVTVDGTIHAKYQDMAEWVPAAYSMPAGTVVVLDAARSNQVTASTKSYDSRVAGVISVQPGLALGEAGEGRVLVATTGRVKVKVDASNGPIAIGDLLVTSDIHGVAMKSKPLNIGGAALHRPGTLIGKALEPLAKGKGEILVLLSLQ